jgi:plasmid stabilization system protein ParE
MKVHWTELAVDQLADIHDFIARSSPRYALRVVDRLTRRSQQIGRFPQSGRAVPDVGNPRIREVLEGPYRIIYHVKADQIDVIAVFHGAQEPPWKTDPHGPVS